MPDLQLSALGALIALCQSARPLVKESRIPWHRLGARGSSRGRRLRGEDRKLVHTGREYCQNGHLKKETGERWCYR